MGCLLRDSLHAVHEIPLSLVLNLAVYYPIHLPSTALLANFCPLPASIYPCRRHRPLHHRIHHQQFFRGIPTDRRSHRDRVRQP